VLHGLSKLCGLPHVKLGWIARAGDAASDPELARGLEWIADTFLSVGAPVQAALPALLEMRHGFRARVLERVASHHARLERAAAHARVLSVLPARGGWSAMLRLPDAVSDEAWAMRLLDRGVAVHPGHFYDVDRPTTVVASLIAAPSAFDEAVTLLERLLEDAE
jgi:aspartate/methionine/tyrosine aminotransferase